MARLPTNPSVISLFVTISTVLGCEVMPAGQAQLEVSPSLASGFVQRLVMQTVADVLELQARSALLPDVVITSILYQLTVKTTYEPMLCQSVAVTLKEEVKMNMIPQRCVIDGITVAGISTFTGNGGMCEVPAMAKIELAPANLTSIS
ncbi:hypothetical protein KIN20_011123 [Parelaphostrongylus tenuis]|uniref:Secreted protein n=1 Tax=Parelaphostrongylus tenuis TaxID=148309 RepID=A0AAD5QLU2_PARTN|nr:hypothetical protein KIN20_011123 [Parelaphostrongylus tenuis]